MSVPIFTEARERLGAIAEGISPEDSIDAIWFRRDALYTGPIYPRWPWPLRPRATKPQPVNVSRFMARAQPLSRFDA